MMTVKRTFPQRHSHELLAAIGRMNFQIANVLMYSAVLIESFVLTVNAFVPFKNAF